MKKGMPAAQEAWSATRVVKTLWPPQAGTLGLRRQFGARLVCVRYRYSPDGRHRYTTVELLVDHASVQSKRSGRPSYEVRFEPTEVQLRRDAKAMGARWDGIAKVWRLSARAVRMLGLMGRASKRTGR